jgi:hypothetical protein
MPDVSRFYPGADALDHYDGAHHGRVRPGDTVAYDCPAAPHRGSPAGDGTPLVIAELVDFGGGSPVQAVLNGGAYECSADNLRAVPAGPATAPEPPPQADAPAPPGGETGRSPAGYSPDSPGCADPGCRGCYPALRGTGAGAVHQPPVRCLSCGGLLTVAWPQGMVPPAARWFHTAAAADHAPELPVTTTGRVLTGTDLAALAAAAAAGEPDAVDGPAADAVRAAVRHADALRAGATRMPPPWPGQPGRRLLSTTDLWGHWPQAMARKRRDENEPPS